MFLFIFRQTYRLYLPTLETIPIFATKVTSLRSQIFNDGFLPDQHQIHFGIFATI